MLFILYIHIYIYVDNDFLDIIIYTYRHFTTADYVMDKLIAKYPFYSLN